MLSLGDNDVLKQTLPSSIAQDETVRDICDAIQPKLRTAFEDTLLVIILPHLDELSEALVDELAWQYHVDFYREDYPLQTKRDLVRTAIERHRRKGTPAAVEDALHTIYETGTVEEWFEYGGEPYHFRIKDITTAVNSAEKIDQVIRLIKEYKNVRSWMDWIQFLVEIHGIIYFGFSLDNSKWITINSDISQEIFTTKNIYIGNYSVMHKEVIYSGELARV